MLLSSSDDQPTIPLVTPIAESDSDLLIIVISTTAAMSALAALGAVMAVAIVCTRLSLCKQQPKEHGSSRSRLSLIIHNYITQGYCG